MTRFILLFALVALVSSCYRQGANTKENFSQKPQRMRLVVGKIKEVSMPMPKDSTIQLLASSENNEIVDVTKQTSQQVNAGQQPMATFLIKGVTEGVVQVTFSQKRINEEGAGDITKTYRVKVVNK